LKHSVGLFLRSGFDLSLKSRIVIERKPPSHFRLKSPSFRALLPFSFFPSVRPFIFPFYSYFSSLFFIPISSTCRLPGEKYGRMFW